MRLNASITFLIAVLFLSSCSGFHLRKNASLPSQYQNIQLSGVADGNGFIKALTVAIENAGGKVRKQASTLIELSNIREDKRIVAYTSERKARIYMLSLKLNYELKHNQKKISQSKINPGEPHRINLDNTYVYDANFALGKAQEEEQIRDKLYAEAARLILLRLKYHK